MLANQHPEISIIVPVYNSDRTLRELHKQLNESLQAMRISYEIIYVNDDSQDNSWSVLTAIKRSDPDRCLVINLMRNYGQHKALLCGFNFSRGKYICTIDDDLQIPPYEIAKLADCARKEEADLVYGIYQNKKHNRIKKMGSRVVELIFAHFASTPGKGSSFKLIRREIAEKVMDFHANYIYLDELLSWHAGNIAFVEVEHRMRKEGQSGYSYRRLFQLAINIILNYTTLPLRLITISGLVFAIIFFIIGLVFIWRKFYVGAEIGFTSIIVTIFFSTGLILFSLGMIGEYINRIFVMHSRKPNFQIKEIR